jgi:hypothetical protein
MEDMLSFITNHIKRNGKTTEGFIEDARLNHSQFYRGVKEPKKVFKKEDMERIATALCLDASEKAKLFSFRDQAESKLIESILFSDPGFAEIADLSNYYFYEGGSNVQKMNAETLARNMAFLPFPGEKAPPEGRDSFEVSVVNCLNYSMLAALAGVFSAIEKGSGEFPGASVRIRHYFPPQSNSTADRLSLMQTLTPMLSMFSGYHYCETVLNHPVWGADSNLCVIRQKRTAPNATPLCRHYLLNINATGKFHAAIFDSPHLYEYFRVDAGDLEKTAGYSALNLNAKLLEATLSHKKVMFHKDPCVDNIQIHLWSNVFARANEELKHSLARVIDPENYYAGLNDEQKLTFGLNFIEKRFLANEQTNAVNILQASGLDEFVRNRYTRDFSGLIPDGCGKMIPLGSLMPFTGEEAREHLAYVKANLGDRNPQGQQFYILRHFSPINANTLLIFQDAFIMAASLESYHPLDGTALYEETACVNAIYSYVMEEVIAKRDALGSILMSDAEAENYIDMLIAQCG